MKRLPPTPALQQRKLIFEDDGLGALCFGDEQVFRLAVDHGCCQFSCDPLRKGDSLPAIWQAKLAAGACPATATKIALNDLLHRLESIWCSMDDRPRLGSEQ